MTGNECPSLSDYSSRSAYASVAAGAIVRSVRAILTAPSRSMSRKASATATAVNGPHPCDALQDSRALHFLDLNLRPPGCASGNFRNGSQTSRQ